MSYQRHLRIFPINSVHIEVASYEEAFARIQAELPGSSRIWWIHLDLSQQTHPILGLEVEKEFCLFRCFRIWLESRNWTESSYNLFNLFGETEGDQRSESLLCKMTAYDRFAVLLTRSTGVTPCGSILFPGYVFIGRWSLLLLHCQRAWWSVQE